MFQPATRKQRSLKFAIAGATGAGKTYSALLMAQAIVQRVGGRIAVGDTENESAAMYAGIRDENGAPIEFDMAPINDHSPDGYMKAVHYAVKSPDYTVLIIDSLSHAWKWLLKYVDQETQKATQQRSRGRASTFSSGWSKATPLWDDFMNDLQTADIHLIVCMRSKMQYVVGSDNQPKKLGMAPIIRDEAEYEFDLVGQFTDIHKHILEIQKSRLDTLPIGATFAKPGAEVANLALDYLEQGITPLEELQRLLGDEFEHLDPYLGAEDKPLLSQCTTQQLHQLHVWLAKGQKKWRDWVRLNSTAVTPSEPVHSEE